MKASSKKGSAAGKGQARAKKSSNVLVGGPKKKPSATEKKPKKADSSVGPKRKVSQASFVSKNEIEHFEERPDPDSPMEKPQDGPSAAGGQPEASPSPKVVEEEESKLEESPAPEERRQSAVDMGVVQDFFLGGGVAEEGELASEVGSVKDKVLLDGGKGLPEGEEVVDQEDAPREDLTPNDEQTPAKGEAAFQNELKEEEQQDDPLEKKTSKETQGENLQKVAEDVKSFAHTDVVGGQQQSALFFDGQGAQEKEEAMTSIDKFKEQNQEAPDEEGLNQIGFMDELEDIQPVNTLDVQADQKDIILASWEQVKEIGVDPVGRILMRNIFDQAPEALDLYSFRNVPNLYTSNELKAHYTKLITALDGVIQTLSSPKDISKTLKAMGKRHLKYGVVKEHYNVIGRSLLMTLDEGLNDDFTPQVRQAWIALIQQISAYMIADNYDSIIQEEEGEDDPITPQNNARQRNRDLDIQEGGLEVPEADPTPSPKVDEGKVLTIPKVRILKKTWATASQVPNVGVKIFENLFDIAPEALDLFPFKDVPNLFESEEMKEHAGNVLNAMSMAIEGIDKLEPAIPKLTLLGGNHLGYKGVEPFHFELLHSAIQFTLEEALGNDYTEEVRDSWATAFNIIKNVMLEKIGKTDLPKYIKRADTREITKEEVDSDSNDLYRNKSNPKKIPKLLSADDIKDSDHEQLADEIKREATILERMSSIAPPVPAAAAKEVEVVPVQEKMMRTTQIIRNEARQHYHDRFRVEVDFHHKIQFRFERAYRLGLKMQDQKRRLNLEIIDLISDFAGYIEHDPMALFYCFYFCIYYNNEELVEFLKNVTSKLPHNDKTERLIEYIDIYGIPKLRAVGEQINQLVFHMVFYQAVDDNLRIVYAQIFKLLRFIQLRDKDALQLLNQRDYELIKLSFEKYTTKINLLQFYSKASPLKASTYRKYNQAYYEEIVINNHIEERVALNYRERFLITAQDIFIVFEMYCKEDYDEQFQCTRKDDITHKQFIDLFVICLRNDSFKIALLIYTLYLNPEEDIDDRILNILLSTIQDSVRFHELKLFFIHEHFQKLSVNQMNQIVDIYQEVISRKDPKMNPMVSQFNTIKITLLVYRICWKIEERQIYSLITKCSVLQNYLLSSLMQYLEKQSNVLVLHKFMTEPILHMTERKDCLDIMYEMNMQELLQHPVVVEVLNLVYEGQYSVSSSPLGMSQTFFCLLEMDTMNLKSITDRLLLNIKTFGDIDSSKQSSLQYNIWKQSIQQREKDEMIFSVLINSIIMILAGMMTLLNNSSFSKGRQAFGHNYYENIAYFVAYSDPRIVEFCESEVDILVTQSKILSIFITLVFVNMLGTFTTMVQKLLTFKFKDNVKLDPLKIIFDLSIVVNSILLLHCSQKTPSNTVISDRCSEFTDLEDGDKTGVDRVFSLRVPAKGDMDFSLMVSLLIIQTTIESIDMLKRTRYLGELIMMLTQMLEEMARFFATFGIIIVLFLVIGILLGMELKDDQVTSYQAFLDLFLAFNGNQDFKQFSKPTGQVYIGTFMYLFKVLLLSLLGAMFINKYKVLFQNIDAHKRFNIIRMKNSESYDKYVGGATLTFYPINIIIMPFLVPIMIVRSTRVSDFALKIQYTLMVVLYCLIISVLIVPAVPLMYLKALANAVFIVFNRVRQDYKGQNVINLVMTLLLTPWIICISIFIDFLALPNLLLKRSDTFEHKYQMSTDKLSPAQLSTVNGTLDTIFGDYESRFKGVSMSLLDLMKMHVKIFSIIENLHDLTCLGNKDYKEALSNVQDYNMTKILSSKCSIPDRSGDFKLARCEIDIIYNVARDINLYNYNDVVLRKLRMNTLQEDVANKALKKKQEAANPSLKMQGMSDKKKHAILKAKEKLDKSKKQGDDSEQELVEGVEQQVGPDNVPLRRNARDVMNNFFIDMVARSYTDIERYIQKERNNIEAKKMKKFEQDLDSKKVMWREQVAGFYGSQAKRYHEFLQSKMYTYKLEMKRKEKEANNAVKSMNSKSAKAKARKIDTISTKQSGPGF